MSKKSSIQYQFMQSINKCFNPGDSKRSDRANPLVDSHTKIYSYAARKELITTAFDFAKFLKQEYQVKNLKEITPDMSQAFLDKKAATDECKHITIKQYQSRLNKLEKVCSNHVRGPLNFMKGVRAPEYADKSKKRDIVLHKNEYKMLCSIPTKSKAQIGLKLAYQFGLRESELVKLKPFDIKSNVLRIVDSKGGKTREVPIVTKEQKKVLQEFKKECSNGLQMRTGSISKWMNRASKKLGLERINQSDSKIHAARKAYSQREYLRLRQEGKTHKEAWGEVSENLGHGRDRMALFRVYNPEL